METATTRVMVCSGRVSIAYSSGTLEIETASKGYGAAESGVRRAVHTKSRAVAGAGNTSIEKGINAKGCKVSKNKCEVLWRESRESSHSDSGRK